MTHLRGIWERGGGQNGDEGGCHWCSDTCRGCWRGVEVRMEMKVDVTGVATPVGDVGEVWRSEWR